MSKMTIAEVEQLRERLLSALAAIEQHNKDDHIDGCYLITDIDLSALRKHDAEVKRTALLEYDLVHFPSLKQHDAEVRKPLVDALRRAKSMMYALRSFIRAGEQLNSQDEKDFEDVANLVFAALAKITQ